MKTTTVKTSRLSGPALDWAVAKSVGERIAIDVEGDLRVDDWHSSEDGLLYTPSDDWSQGGPLLDRLASLTQDESGNWHAIPKLDYDVIELIGSTLLIAACRAIVASELGDTVQVPAELVEAS